MRDGHMTHYKVETRPFENFIEVRLVVYHFFNAWKYRDNDGNIIDVPERSLPSLTSDGTEYMFIHKPNFIERLFGITWKSKIAKAEAMFDRRGKKMLQQQAEAIEVLNEV